MDISAIIVVIVLTALSLAAIVWLEIYSRRNHRQETPADRSGSGVKDNHRSGSVSENSVNEV